MLIILPVRKIVAERYEDLSELLVDNEIAENQTVRAAFSVDNIDNVFEAKNDNYDSVAIIESNGFFYQVPLPFDIVIDDIKPYRDVKTVE